MVGIISILKTFANRKDIAANTLASLPLDIQLGHVVEISDLAIELAKIDGSIIGDFKSVQRIVAVGKIKMFQTDIYNVYLEDNKTILRIVVKDGNISCVVFHLKDEIHPQNEEEWGFWLDEKEGLLGWPQFQTDQTIYDREWLNKEYSENITPCIGPSVFVEHNGAEYVKYVDKTLEHVLVQTHQTNDECNINIYIGVGIEISNIKII
jgi:hypothetical protein